MEADAVKNSSEIIERVEQVLQTAYESAGAFNTAFDGEEPITIPSLLLSEGYQIEASEILFWADRNAYFEEYEAWKQSHTQETHQPAIEQLKSNDQLTVFHDLVGAIKRNRVAPFVGAGMSQACDFPLWGAALNLLSSRIEGVDPTAFMACMNSYDYLKAAQLLWDKDQTQVKNFIRNKFSGQTINERGLSGPIKLLPKLSRGCVITTNFDPVIELVIGRGNLEGYMHGMQQGNKFVPKLIKGDRCILKLHGDAEDYDTYVFTESQYTQAYGAPDFDFTKPLPRALRQIFVSHSLLFLGCSLEQDRTLELFKKVCGERQFEIPDHYAILPLPASTSLKSAKEGRLLDLKIRPIWYTPSNGHQLVENYLALAVDMAEGRITSI